MTETKTPLIEIVFVIQGTEYQIEVNPHAIIRSGVEKALHEAKIPGSTEGWQLRTVDGHQIDMSKSFEDERINSGVKLFLSKGPGRGG